MLTKESTKSSSFSSAESFDENAPGFIANIMARVESARNPGKRISLDELFVIVADKRKVLLTGSILSAETGCDPSRSSMAAIRVPT